MKLSNYKNKFTSFWVLALIGLGALTACNKENGGDYNFINTENVFEGSSYEYIVSKKGIYDSLVKAIDRIGWLKDSLSSPDTKLTLFAPSNSSLRVSLFALNIARDNLDKQPLYIHSLDSTQLDSLLSRYVVQDKITTEAIQFVDGKDLLSVRYNYPMHGLKAFSEANGFQGGGPTNIIFSDTKESVFIREWVSTQTNVVNIITQNGVVHHLDPKYDFGFGEFNKRFNK